MDIWLSLLGIHTATINRGRIIYWRAIVPSAIILTLLCLVGLIFNLLDMKGLNLFVSLILVISVITVGLRPEVIINLFLAGIASGIAQTPQTMPGEIKKFFTWYLGMVEQMLLWISIVFFFLGTLNVHGHFGAFLGILAAIVLIQLIQVVWKIGKSFSKKFIYYYAILMLILFCGSFLSISDSWKNAVATPQAQRIIGMLQGTVSKKVQDTNTYHLPKNTPIYQEVGGKMQEEMRYDKVVIAISLNKMIEQNGAVYEMVGLPDPTTGQPGAKVGWVFSGDLDKPRVPTPIPNPQTVVVTTPPVVRMVPAKPAATTSLPTASPASREERWNMEFYRGNQKYEQEVSVVRNGNDIVMITVADNTVFRGTLDGNYYRGNLDGGGTFNICFSGRTAYGNLSSNENLDFTMKRLS